MANGNSIVDSFAKGLNYGRLCACIILCLHDCTLTAKNIGYLVFLKINNAFYSINHRSSTQLFKQNPSLRTRTLTL